MSDPVGFTFCALAIVAPVIVAAIGSSIQAEREKNTAAHQQRLLKAENVYLKRRLRKARKRLTNEKRLRRLGESAIYRRR